LEKLAPNQLKEKGADLADVIIKMDWRQFRGLPVSKSDDRDDRDALKRPFFSNESKDHSLKQDKPSNHRAAIEKTFPDLPFEETQLYQNLMFDMLNCYFTHPLINELRMEKPCFTDHWNEMYIQIRNSPPKKRIHMQSELLFN